MGFFSWLFGRDEPKKPTEEELETSEGMEEILEEIAESGLDLSPLDRILGDSKGNTLGYSVSFDDEGSPLLILTVDGDSGERSYEKRFEDVETANAYFKKAADNLYKWISQNKSLYQTMGYLNLKRLS